MLDFVIKGATIVDGTGADRETGDLGVRDGRIVARGKVDEPARETVSADGALLTPGWDRRTHALRRPGHLGRPDRSFGLARCHDHRHGQLRRRFRAVSARR